MSEVKMLATPLQRRRLVVTGVVQGVGFRPFVATLAAHLGLTGHCGNDAVSVFIEAEGPGPALDELATRLREQAPPLAVVTGVGIEEIAARGDSAFTIVPSRTRPGDRTLVPPDTATCEDCLREMGDPADRRHRHPFITCTNCGPRFTIITDLPYDRPATTMAAFEMCARCREEYAAPGDRRHHAQPIACHDCGPSMWLETSAGARVPTAGDDAVLTHVQRALGQGEIVAIKGIGGFHLACDATNRAAVATLRKRKRRPDKPLAVMVPDLRSAARLAVLSPDESRSLAQAARPIVLVRSAGDSPLAEGVAPRLDEVGLMLPYTPMQHLLLAALPGSDLTVPTTLVMTSGNLSGEPLCHRNDDARQRLSGIADLFLMHDREIAVPCDDSVITVLDDAEVPLRRSRGRAPLPVMLPGGGPAVLAVGAEVKNTFCLTRHDLAFCSGHLGDMGSLESRHAFESAVDQAIRLHGATPELVVADDHPGYATRAWAEEYSDRAGIPLLTVQHHHAHVASLLADHGLVGRPVIGVAFDGTGYGCDHTVWGGELLHVGHDVGVAERVGHLEPFLLPGGDRAVRNPFRVALSLLRATGLDALDLTGLPLDEACSAAERQAVVSQMNTDVACVETTSVGRLFDGVASLLGVSHRVTHEGQAAIELEALARAADRPVHLRMDVSDGQLCLGGLVSGLVDGIRAGLPTAGLALGFHLALGTAASTLARDAARAAALGDEAAARGCGVSTVGLTGGVFANRILLSAMRHELESAGLQVITHQRVPANDGGLALGQAVVARARNRTSTRQEDA
ncbi:MAG: carbamoyltransferase HypF [Nocardioides sp.]|nr:carbamoyltransferase HypF [Nocardioides sp.]